LSSQIARLAAAADAVTTRLRLAPRARKLAAILPDQIPGGRVQRLHDACSGWEEHDAVVDDRRRLVGTRCMAHDHASWSWPTFCRLIWSSGLYPQPLSVRRQFTQSPGSGLRSCWSVIGLKSLIWALCAATHRRPSGRSARRRRDEYGSSWNLPCLNRASTGTIRALLAQRQGTWARPAYPRAPCGRNRAMKGHTIRCDRVPLVVVALVAALLIAVAAHGAGQAASPGAGGNASGVRQAVRLRLRNARGRRYGSIPAEERGVSPRPGCPWRAFWSRTPRAR
jgi:hypothetical protein